MIHTHVDPDHESASRTVATLIEGAVTRRPDALLCVASGSTPTRAYELFVGRALERPSLVEKLRVLKLDEWGGLPMESDATCETHLGRVLVDPLGLGPRYWGFQSEPSDPEAECERIAGWLATHGPIDLCVLGLGVNGHLGFNEPAETLKPHAHVAELSPASLSHAMVQRLEIRPRYGLTLGMADLLGSREIVVIATGEAKRGPIARLLAEEISTGFPASLLHLHTQTTLVCDVSGYPQERDRQLRS